MFEELQHAFHAWTNAHIREAQKTCKATISRHSAAKEQKVCTAGVSFNIVSPGQSHLPQTPALLASCRALSSKKLMPMFLVLAHAGRRYSGDRDRQDRGVDRA